MGKAQTDIKSSEALSLAKKAQIEVSYLQEQINTLELTVQGLWQLLKDKQELTDESLHKQIKELDASDHDKNGKIKEPPEPCPACHRPVPHRRKYCLYCGTKMEVTGSF